MKFAHTGWFALALLGGCARAPQDPPFYTAQSIATHGSTAGGVVTPGKPAIIYGKNLGPEKPCEGSETQLCGTAVRLTGRTGTEQMWIRYASAGQVNFLAPANLPAGEEVELSVTRDGSRGPMVRVRVAAQP